MSSDGTFVSRQGESKQKPEERRARGLVAHLRRGVLELQGACPGPESDQGYGVFDRTVAPLVTALRREVSSMGQGIELTVDELERLLESLAGIAPSEGRTPFELAMQSLVALGSIERQVEKAEKRQ